MVESGLYRGFATICIDARCSVVQFSYTRELLHVGLCQMFLSTRFIPKLGIKPVYVICRLPGRWDLSFWVGFWRSGNALNVINIYGCANAHLRTRSLRPSYGQATSRTCRVLIISVVVCEKHPPPAATAIHYLSRSAVLFALL